MSWSAYFIGNPDKIVKALEDQSATLTGPSKTEYDAALPHLIGLVQQNMNKTQPPVLKLAASGHGYFVNDEPQYTTCNASIEVIGGVLV
jgi:hypothetical protein